MINIVRSGRRRAGKLVAVCLLIGTSVASASAEPLPPAPDDSGRIYGYVFAAPVVRFVTYCEDFNPRTLGMTYAGRGAPGLRLEGRSSFWEDYRTLELRLGVIFGGS